MQTTELAQDTVRLTHAYGATRLADGEEAANKAAKASLAPPTGRVVTLLSAVLLAAVTYNLFFRRKAG